jgi:hypothetical protein
MFTERFLCPHILEANMKIGIIGAGNIGGTLARRLVSLGHEVVIANSRGPELSWPLRQQETGSGTPNKTGQDPRRRTRPDYAAQKGHPNSRD